MLVPEHIARFLDRATFAIAGTRDSELVPHVHRVSGWRITPDRKYVDCFIAPEFSRHLLSSLEDNGEISVTASEVPSHETYQFKGKFVDCRDVGSEELEIYHAYRDRAARRILELFDFPDPAVRAYVPVPTLIVRFEVRDIFDQTPGPDAGRRVDVEEAR
jgi:hypothetical protein